jgi:hypothetical protein
VIYTSTSKELFVHLNLRTSNIDLSPALSAFTSDADRLVLVGQVSAGAVVEVERLNAVGDAAEVVLVAAGRRQQGGIARVLSHLRCKGQKMVNNTSSKGGFLPMVSLESILTLMFHCRLAALAAVPNWKAKSVQPLPVSTYTAEDSQRDHEGLNRGFQLKTYDAVRCWCRKSRPNSFRRR